MKIRRIAALIGSIFLSFQAFAAPNPTPSKSPAPIQKQALKRIIIDAGHGGSDIGARGRYSTEKDISLAISLKLEAQLKQALPDVEILMTRRTDVFNSVIEKADIANRLKGDLFICIHVNSAGSRTIKEVVGYKTITVKGKKGKKVKKQVPQYKVTRLPSTAIGTETFIFGVDKSDERVAAAGESVDEYLDSVSLKILEARKQTDANDPTKQMLASIMAQQYFQRSAKLALTIEEEFQKLGRVSRQAQQRKKGIWVLQAVSMPAVLVETGFISNPDEEDYLNSELGQLEICDVITKSVRIYKKSLENQIGVGANKP
jgi:N-acetylmuramoyl-L-alanine amidase